MTRRIITTLAAAALAAGTFTGLAQVAPAAIGAAPGHHVTSVDAFDKWPRKPALVAKDKWPRKTVLASAKDKWPKVAAGA